MFFKTFHHDVMFTVRELKVEPEKMGNILSSQTGVCFASF